MLHNSETENKQGKVVGMPELQNTSMAPSRIDGLVPVPYVGISFLQSWIFMLFYARSAGIEAAAPI